MPIFQLSDDIIFPDPSLAEENGLLAIGGDLSPERIINAYTNGIFPWYSEGEPILWWSPNPRCVLFPGKFKPSKSLSLLVKKNYFIVKFDSDFSSVIEMCSTVNRPDQPGTWITPEMKHAYIKLHKLGYAHSVESYYENKLVGGLYGIAIGNIFFGESMFYKVSNASKVAFFYLVGKLIQWNFELIDNQTTSQHLINLGSEEIDRNKFLEIIKISALKNNLRRKWQ